MPSYTVNAINIGSFDLGESDKVLTVFSRERGMLKAVAKGVKRPGTRMAGRADVLNVNELFLSSGRSFEIITQAQSLETFSKLREDLVRLSCGLYYAELTHTFGKGLSEESSLYFDYLCSSLKLLAESGRAAGSFEKEAGLVLDPIWLCLEFEMGLLNLLGFSPELVYCVGCRQVIVEYNLSRFNLELGGVVCQSCFRRGKELRVHEAKAREQENFDADIAELSRGLHISPLVWKNLILAAERKATTPFIEGDEIGASDALEFFAGQMSKPNLKLAVQAGQRLIQSYIEHRCGRKFKSLTLLEQFK